jgi:hypothetical protein
VEQLSPVIAQPLGLEEQAGHVHTGRQFLSKVRRNRYACQYMAQGLLGKTMGKEQIADK